MIEPSTKAVAETAYRKALLAELEEIQCLLILTSVA